MLKQTGFALNTKNPRRGKIAKTKHKKRGLSPEAFAKYGGKYILDTNNTSSYFEKVLF